MSSNRPEPGEARRQLSRPPGERYARPAAEPANSLGPMLAPVAVGLIGVILFVVLGGLLAVTAGLVIVAAVIGWILGRLVSPPWRAAAAGALVVLAGFVAIWLFGRIEGGVLDPIAYLVEVEGPAIVVLALAASSGLAAAASR